MQIGGVQPKVSIPKIVCSSPAEVVRSDTEGLNIMFLRPFYKGVVHFLKKYQRAISFLFL